MYALLTPRPRAFLRPLILLSALLINAGCGAPAAPSGQASPAPAAAQPASAAQPGSITYAFPDDPASTRAADALIKAYATANPDLRVNSLPLAAASYQQALLAQLEAGAVDLFVAADGQAPALINRKAALDLSGLLPSVQPSDFQPAALGVWQRGDALYGLPTDITPQVMFYNQDLFDAAGVAVPASGWTWDDWLSKAKQLTVRSGDQVIRHGTALSQWSPLVWGNGGELLSADGMQTLLDQPAATEGVQFAADMINVHKVAPLPKDAGGPDPVQLFQAQQVAMMPGSSGLAASLLAAKLPFKWGIAPLPVGKTPATPLSITGLLISARSKNQAGALDFAGWLAGPQGSALRAPILPYAAPALRAAEPRASAIVGAAAIPQAIANGRTLPQLEVWPQVKALIDAELKPVWQGQTTAAAAYRSIAPKVNGLLKAG